MSVGRSLLDVVLILEVQQSTVMIFQMVLGILGLGMIGIIISNLKKHFPQHVSFQIMLDDGIHFLTINKILISCGNMGTWMHGTVKVLSMG